MHTIEKLERLKDLAERAGYTVRQEWLGGVAGGACQFAGRKWIFIDLSLSVIEQLEQVAAALDSDPVAVTHAGAFTPTRHPARRLAA
jgi:hypothetical protein